MKNQFLDYGMDPDITEHPAYKDLITPALLALPSLSLVMKFDDLFDEESGMWMNSRRRGRQWERPCSLELIHPDGRPGFQSDAGIRIRGGYSRKPWNCKYSLRLYFREKYGPRKLRYPLFDDEGVSAFEKLDLRSTQNHSWSFNHSVHATFNRDLFSRDTQRDLGRPYTRGRYYHLYLNGVYWGIYQSAERPDSDYAASYLGGISDDYDVLKRHRSNKGITATDGDLELWNRVWDLCVRSFADDADYLALEGLDPAGRRDPGKRVLVDIDNLIDYMLIIFFTGNHDAPVSKYTRNKKMNNWFGIGRRIDREQGFIFLMHDSEQTLFLEPPFGITVGLHENRVNIADPTQVYGRKGVKDPAFQMVVTEARQFHPQWLHHRLCDNAKYRARFATRARELLAPNGALGAKACIARFNQRVRELELAVVAESARWGDILAKKRTEAPPLTRDEHWRSAVALVVERYFPERGPIVIEQLRAAGLY